MSGAENVRRTEKDEDGEESDGQVEKSLGALWWN